MQYSEWRVNADFLYLLPISDCHIGSPGFTSDSYTLLCKNVEWALSEPNAFVFLNGDILHTATRYSKSNPMVARGNLKEQLELATRIFTPLAKKNKIIGAIDGNHEQRLEDIVGYSPTIALCDRLDIPYYRYSCVIRFIVGKLNKRGGGFYNKIGYSGYFHHTTGGGSTVGGKINRVDKLRQIVANADFYVGSHNHQLGVMPVSTHQVDPTHKRIIVLRQLLIDSGGYEEWRENYPERLQYPITKMGSPRIRMDGKRHDIHCSV